jgi:hypothetical protein
MKFDGNLAAIHAYLCADGYVIKNPPTQKNKYYRIALRNINPILLKDFQKRFEKIFGVRPTIRKEGRCEKCSKEIYYKLTKEFTSFYSREWQIPRLNKKLSCIWLRAFFDCEGWVFNKSHQNRHIGLDSINENGLDDIRNLLDILDIRTIKKVVKNGKMYRIFIYGKENLIKFQNKIGFLHPDKKRKLDEAIKDYIDYFWNFPRDKVQLKDFVRKLVKEKARVKKPYQIRITSKEETNLSQLKKHLKYFYKIDCSVSKRINGLGTIYYVLYIGRKSEVQRLISLGLIEKINGI